MVTASHNPARDNGVKVYLGDGAQIIPPADRDISAAIDAVGAAGSLPRSDRFATVGDEIVEAYLDRVVGAVGSAAGAQPHDLRIVYTPLHGVGLEIAQPALARAGFTDVHTVAAQARPDPDFPTAPFPNPEEPGVMDLALADAQRLDADIVLANDPDADRLAVAVGGRRLTGDEVGCLLGHHLLSSGSAGAGRDRLVVTTIVSSTLLGKIAADLGAHHERTLTGFKWVIRPALAHPEWDFVMGYEEALGYAVGDAVRDKDGITAAVAVAQLAAKLKAEGRTLLDRLAELDDRYGRHRTGQRSFRIPPDAQDEAMARVRARPGARDLRPSADVVEIDEPGRRVVFRTSGTEPKLKVYAEVIDGADSEVGAALDAAAGWAGLTVG
jgi:phosphomannomutase